MKTRLIIPITTLLLMLFAVSSCDNSINTDLEETLAPYLELEAIDEASNTTLTIRRGTAAGLDSYFAFDVSNIETNGIISEGLVEGWCLEWDKPIAQNNDRHDGVEAYSTFGSEKWKPVNYLMSIKNKLKREDPSLTYKEIQVAIWSLIDVPRFNVDEVLAAGRMPSRMMTNGQPNFSVSKVKDIVDRVRSNADAYTYTETTPFMVFARTENNSQNGGFVPCESGDADQCEGYVSISGSVYVDANGNETLNSSESGIQNVTVTLTDEYGNEHVTQTETDGFYSFVVFTGDEETSFSLEIEQETDNTEDFNEGLFDTYLPTTPISGISVSIAEDNVSGINFGFEPDIDGIIIALLGGDGVEPTIVTNTETKMFWTKQLVYGLLSELGLATGILTEEIPSEVPLSLLTEHLEDIENLLKENPFQFGENKVYAALLTILRNSSDLERLLAELLTAELNVVSGRGSGSIEFDLALMAFGESSAIELSGSLPGLRAATRVETTNADGMPDFKSMRTVEDAEEILHQIRTSQIGTASVTTGIMPLTSSAELDDAEPLLQSYNLSGGGGGSVGPAE
ncbi:SdrD B-like domain-containing protein [Rhodohalobacter sp. 8-1]|uniref:SdrD B-like domain-containing protein n=1 Tax=Rhodohalobacter sp. 8-1 TaxID=3131972 RepID=UPI0030EBB0B0